MPTSVFIASSGRGKEIAQRLKEKLSAHAKLSAHGIRVSVWTEVFRTPSKSFIDTLREQLDNNDFFITILTPDAQIIRAEDENNSPQVHIGSDNVIFEAGAVFGRLDLSRLFFVWDQRTRTPTDLGIEGRLAYPIRTDTTIQEWGRQVDSIAAKIAAAIEEKLNETRIDDGRIRWLSLIGCAPGAQRKVIKKIDDMRHVAENRFQVRYEGRGVVWGPPDDYLLFSVPNPECFTGFVRHFRNSFDKTITSIDSRMLFPKWYWRRLEKEQNKKSLSTLVLLSCKPNHVEDVFGHCEQIAEGSIKTDLPGVSITNIGIMTGEDDVMLLVNAPTLARHQEFVEQFLQPQLGGEEWLARNTTSLLTSH